MEQGRQSRSEPGLESGVSLVEITLGLTLLTIGLLGFVGAIVSTQVMVRVTKETNIANAAIISTIDRLTTQDDKGAAFVRTGFAILK